MALELSLVIKGDQSGAKKALEDTATGIETLGNKAKTAATPTREVADGVGKIATEAPAAKTAIDDVGTAVDGVKTKFSGWQAAALGAIGGIAGALGSAVLEAALATAVDAIGGYFGEITNSAANVASDLEAHKNLVASIKGLWDDNKNAASDYGLTSAAGLQFEARSNVRRLDSDFQSATLSATQGVMFIPEGMIGGPSAEARDPFRGSVAKLLEDFKDGRADVIAFREEVATIANALPEGSEGQSYAERLLGDTKQAATLQAELQRAIDLVKATGGDADAAAASLGKVAEGMTATATEAGVALPVLTDYARMLATIGGVTVSLPDGSTATGNPGTVGGGFAQGGYTGHMPTDQVAGFVHGREYVFDAESTARIGVGNLEAMRRGVKGYATGGGVGIPAITSPIGGGTLGFDLAGSFDLLKGVANDLARALKSTEDGLGGLDNVLGNLAGKFLNMAGSIFDQANPGLGGIGGFLASLFGGFFADGGDMQAGKFYAVGEGGPELFAPGMSGTMIPNHALGGGVQFQQNIINNSSEKVRTRQRSDGQGNVIQEMVIGTVKKGIAEDEFRANGLRGPTKSR